MRKLSMLGIAIVLAAAAGCASGPKFDTVATSLAPVPSGKARIYIYRSSALGAAIQPEVKLNGAVVGTAEPNGVFYVDRDPGNMEVITGSEVDRKLTFTAAAGETRYVKLGVGFGVLVWRIIPELVSETEAKKDMADLAYTGAGGAAK
jgi:hypothetical protein